MDDNVAAPERATPDEQSVLIGRMLDSRRSQVLMKAPEAEKRIFEDLSYSTPTTGPGWADKLMDGDLSSWWGFVMESFVLPVRSGARPQIPYFASTIRGRGEKQRVRGFDGQHRIAVTVDDVSAQEWRADLHLNEKIKRFSCFSDEKFKTKKI